MAKMIVASLIVLAFSTPEPWLQSHFTPQPLPSVWVPAGTPPSKLTDEAVLSAGCCPLDVAAFVAQFGAPNRYLVSKSKKPGENALVYDLPKHTVLLYVANPPITALGAVAVQDKHGKTVRLIK